MPEVLDVITRINYEVDSSALQDASKEINNQISAIGTLANRVAGLQSALDKTGSEETERRRRINILLAENKTRLDALTTSYSKQFVEQAKAAKGAQQVKKQFDSLNVAIGQLVREAPNAAISLQTFLVSISNQFGQLFDGFSARLAKLRSEGKPTSAIFKEVASSLFSVNTIVSAGIPILLIMAQKLFEIGSEAKKSKAEVDEFAKSIKSVTDQVGTEVANVIQLTETANNLGLSYTERAKAIKELETATNQYFTVADKEKILNGELALSYDFVTEAILKGAKARLLQAQVTDLAQQSAAAQLELDRAQSGELFITQERISQLRDVIKLNGVRIDQLTKTGQLEKETANISFGAISETVRRESEAAKARDKERAKEILYGKDKKKRQKEERDAIKDFINQSAASIDEAFANLKEETLKLQEALGTDYYNSPEYKKFQLDFQTNAAKQADKNRAEQEKKEQDADKKRQERLKKYVSAYQQAAATVAQVINNQLQLEISAIDTQIKAQERRVDEAEKLAERGNTESLKLERDRLNELTRQREQFARRQQAINAILTLSNSILAVATAAGESGAGAIAVVPAVIAAIAAGYGAVTALFRSNETEGFKDGVIDYKGKGTGTSDSNLVRISRGESVITADATRKYRPVLEAMNNGTFRNSVSQIDNRKELNRIAELLEYGDVHINNNFNEHGWNQRVERNMRKQRNLRK